MPIKKPFFLCLLFTILSISVLLGQATFEVPQNAEFKTKEDYAKYEASVIDAAKWLESTDLDKETEKRKQVNGFVSQWLSGSPTVNVDIGENLLKLYGKNAELLGIYIASYARNFLENRNTATKFSATKAGLTSMMNVYEKGINVSRSKELEKLIKLTEENKLDQYINDNFR